MADTNVTEGDANITETTALVDDINDNEVTIGPDHALYGLMIAWEKLYCIHIRSDTKTGKTGISCKIENSRGKGRIEDKRY